MFGLHKILYIIQDLHYKGLYLISVTVTPNSKINPFAIPYYTLLLHPLQTCSFKYILTKDLLEKKVKLLSKYQLSYSNRLGMTSLQRFLEKSSVT